MSVGASKTHNLILNLDIIASECKCMSRLCDVCNPNPTTDLVFDLKDDLLSLEKRFKTQLLELAQKEARIKELERMVDGLKSNVDDLVKIHNRKQFASGAFD